MSPDVGGEIRAGICEIQAGGTPGSLAGKARGGRFPERGRCGQEGRKMKAAARKRRIVLWDSLAVCVLTWCAGGCGFRTCKLEGRRAAVQAAAMQGESMSASSGRAESLAGLEAEQYQGQSAGYGGAIYGIAVNGWAGAISLRTSYSMAPANSYIITALRATLNEAAGWHEQEPSATG